MGRYSPVFLDSLRSRISLSSLIQNAVKLTRRGHEYTGLCPFHKEKTGSFTVNDDKGFYHCFGCGAHGDIISWMMNYEHLSYPDAIKTLAQKAGVSLPQITPQEQIKDNQKTDSLNILEKACQFYEKNLYSEEGISARAYLQTRCIPKQTALLFRLGFSGGKNSLCAFLEKEGFSMKSCVQSGLIVWDETRKKYRDYFFNRLMFPIFSKTGKVIAFGGRILGEGSPKYLNSPETHLFHKGQELYGLSQAVKNIHTNNQAIIVEGYMDVISLYSAGITYAVAPLGTALTEEQLKLLWRHTDTPVICFDGDIAGQKASSRALQRSLPLLEAGKSLLFLTLPEGLDPDDIIKKNGATFFKKLVATAQPLLEILWKHIYEDSKPDTPEKIALLEKNMQATLQSIKHPTIKELYKQETDRRIFGLKKKTKFNSAKKIPKLAPPSPSSFDLKTLMAYLIVYPDMLIKNLDALLNIPIQEPFFKQLLTSMLNYLMEYPEATSEDIQAYCPETSLIKQEIFLIKKQRKQIHEVQKDIYLLSKAVTTKTLQKELNLLIQEHAKNPSEALWEKILNIKNTLSDLQAS